MALAAIDLDGLAIVDHDLHRSELQPLQVGSQQIQDEGYINILHSLYDR